MSTLYPQPAPPSRTPQQQRNSRTAAVVLLLIWVLAFGGGAAWLVQVQQTGDPSTASVTECQNGRRSFECYGIWTVDGVRTGGQVTGVNSDDVGTEVDVLVRGDVAHARSLRLPIILGGLALLAPVWATVGAVNNRRRPHVPVD